MYPLAHPPHLWGFHYDQVDSCAPMWGSFTFIHVALSAAIVRGRTLGKLEQAQFWVGNL